MSDIGLLLRDPKATRASVFAGMMLVALFSGAWYGMEFLNTPPIDILESRMVSNTVKQGDPIKLYVRVTSYANRQCPGNIVREWTKPVYFDGRVMPEIFRDDAPAPMVHYDRHEYVVSIPTIIDGQPLPLGAWNFQGETQYFCSWFTKGRYRTRVNTVEIVSRG